jgi:hypothetical protein
MNERLRELMLEAGYAAPELAGRALKLSELIIKECANFATTEYDKRGAIDGVDLLKHFGVEP